MSLKLELTMTLPDIDNPIQTGDPNHRRNCRQLEKLFHKLAGGNLITTGGAATLDFKTSAVAASGSVYIVNGATSLATVIGGTTVTTTYSAAGGAGQTEAHDNLTMASHVTDINADTTVNKWVTASVAGRVAASEYVTFSSVDSGAQSVVVNGITVSQTGTGVDDTDGTSMAAAINASTITSVATAAYDTGTNRLTITAVAAGSAGNAITLTASGTGLTAHAAVLSGGKDKINIVAKVPGVIGNSISLTSASTGVTVSAGRLASGSESRVVYSL